MLPAYAQENDSGTTYRAAHAFLTSQTSLQARFQDAHWIDRVAIHDLLDRRWLAATMIFADGGDAHEIRGREGGMCPGIDWGAEGKIESCASTRPAKWRLHVVSDGDMANDMPPQVLEVALLRAI